jgi:hypothetical protein
MSRLEAVQTSIGTGILTGRFAGIEDAIADSDLDPGRRLQIYGNHYLVTLEEALGATFPAVRALVGDGFFGCAARRFAVERPPRGPCLHEYGGTFPDFLAELPEVRALPYLADVARLEWAANLAYHATDARAIALDRLAAIAPELYGHLRFGFHPAASLVASPYPLTAIWQAALPGSDPELRVDADAGGERVLVFREADEVVFHTLDEAEYRFLATLSAAGTVGEAASAALIAAPGFDVAASLAAWLERGLFTDFVVIPTRRRELAPC